VRFSVVVPAFNEERYLPRSLSSLRQAALVLEDAFPGEAPEVIVVDNGSTDHTADVARDFEAVVVDEKRRGIAIARNAGARKATGDVLVFLDADYRVLPSFLTRVAHRYEQDPSMAGAGVRVALEPSEIDPITRSLGYAGLMLLRRVRNMSFGVATFRRDCFEALGGFDESLYAFEDVEILQRLAGSAHRAMGLYRILTDVLVLASARGFYRGGVLGMGEMLRTYARMTLSPTARRDINQCGYWYERE
jgi:glycosyltransferase involved in cell wall biosynthesis